MVSPAAAFDTFAKRGFEVDRGPAAMAYLSLPLQRSDILTSSFALEYVFAITGAQPTGFTRGLQLSEDRQRAFDLSFDGFQPTTLKANGYIAWSANPADIPENQKSILGMGNAGYAVVAVAIGLGVWGIIKLTDDEDECGPNVVRSPSTGACTPILNLLR